MNPSRSLVTLVWVLGVAAPVLDSIRIAPLGNLLSEAVSIGLFFLASIGVYAFAPRSDVKLSRSPALVGLGIFALVAAQVGLGKYEYYWVATFWAGFLLLFVLMYWTGQLVAQKPEWRVEIVDALAVGVLLAAGLNVAAQTIQALGLAGHFQPFVFMPGLAETWREPACRPGGNLAQANHANTLAWMGIAAAIYLWRVRRVLPLVAALTLGLFLLWGSAVAGSRMAWLYVALAMAFALFYPSAFNLNRRAAVAGALLLAILYLALNGASAWVGGDACMSATGRLTDTSGGQGNWIRIGLARQALELWQTAPWLGVGLGKVLGGTYFLDQDLSIQQPIDFFSHNLVLQILAETGLVGGVLILGGLVLWILRAWWQRERDAANGMLLFWSALLLIHSMLEYALWYGNFLAPFAFALGYCAGRPSGGWELSNFWRLSVVAVGCAGLIGTLYLIQDYRRAESAINLAQISQRLGPGRTAESDALVQAAADSVEIFTPIVDRMMSGFSSADAARAETLREKNLALLRNLPMPANITNQILLDAYLGQPDEARIHLRRMLAFYPTRSAEQLEYLRKMCGAPPERFESFCASLEGELRNAPKPR